MVTFIMCLIAIDVLLQTTMNLLLLGAAALPVGYMAFGFISLVVPPK